MLAIPLPVIAAAALLAAAQVTDPDAGYTVTWIPERPVQGSLIYVRVTADGDGRSNTAISAVYGQVVGQPLHFEVVESGGWGGLAGIPIGAVDSIELRLTVERNSGELEILRTVIPVASLNFPLERLRVPPEFVQPPDSAVAARIAAERRKAREVSLRSHSTPRLWTAEFVRPRPGRITSDYGRRRILNGTVRTRHLGVDFAGAEGEPVRAANRGVVALVAAFYLAGNVVYIDHGAGLVTAYLHLSDVAVAQGDTVMPGQLVGQIGSTGRVTGPHLHWVMRYGTVTVDPLSLFSLGLGDLHRTLVVPSPLWRRPNGEH